MSLNKQIKERRQQLGLAQKDMKLRIGMEQQQYSRIEAGGNANLKNLELIAEGLDAELMLIPKEKRQQVLALLEEKNSKVKSYSAGHKQRSTPVSFDTKNLSAFRKTINSVNETLNILNSKPIPEIELGDATQEAVKNLAENLKKLNSIKITKIKLDDLTINTLQQLESNINKLRIENIHNKKLESSLRGEITKFHNYLNEYYNQYKNSENGVNVIDDPWEDILD